MRLGILADVHANIDALEAVLRDGRGLVERWWFLGDALGRGPFPVETLQRLRQVVQPAHWRMGNHDLYVTGALAADGVRPEDRFTYADHRVQLQAFRPTGRAALWAWCRRGWRLDRATPRRVATDAAEYWLVHASLGNEKYNVGDVPDSYLLPWRDDAYRRLLDEQLAQLNAQRARTAVLIHGHTHVPYLAVQRRGGTPHELGPIRYEEWQALAEFQAVLINPGSVGQPRNSDPRVHAAYGILDTANCAFMFRRVFYDSERTRLKMAELNYDRDLIRQLEGNHVHSALRHTHALWLEWERTYRAQPWGWEPIV